MNQRVREFWPVARAPWRKVGVGRGRRGGRIELESRPEVPPEGEGRGRKRRDFRGFARAQDETPGSLPLGVRRSAFGVRRKPVGRESSWPNEKLPVRYSQRSKKRPLSAPVEASYYVHFENKQRVMASGEKPKIYGKKVPTERLKRSLEAKRQPVNCIKVARRYEAELKLPTSTSYAVVGERFGVSRTTVCYYLALVTRLPEDFVNWLEHCKEDVPVRFFSQKRLRPVTVLDESVQREALLNLAEKLVLKTDGDPSEAVSELLQLLGGDLPRPNAHMQQPV